MVNVKEIWTAVKRVDAEEIVSAGAIVFLTVFLFLGSVIYYLYLIRTGNLVDALLSPLLSFSQFFLTLFSFFSLRVVKNTKSAFQSPFNLCLFFNILAVNFNTFFSLLFIIAAILLFL